MTLHDVIHYTAREFILYTMYYYYTVCPDTIHTVEVFYCKFTVQYAVCVIQYL